MRIPQVIMGIGLVVLVILLAVPGHRVASYESGNEVAIEGTVQEVQDFYCPISGTEGTHLLVATGDGVIQVHVAPKNFLRGNDWKYKPGDRVRVVGSKTPYAGHESIVARTVSRDNVTLSFRKTDGKPLWVE